jgi:predicted chitinase
MYRGRGGKVRSHLGIEYDKYKKNLPATEETSKSGGHELIYPLQRHELLEIFDGIAKDLSGGKVPEATIDFYLEKLNQAFNVLKINTVEAQASFLANAYEESDQFRYMTETQKAISSNQPYQADPTKVKLNETWLNKAAAKRIPGVINYEPGGSINPMSDWQKSFIGRGPVQVTHRHYYVQAIAVLEKRAEELEKADPKSSDAKDIREAIDHIKSDPRQAANPKYAFFFSAAFMKMPDSAKGTRGDVKATKGQVTSWMGKQTKAAEKKKRAAYKKAFGVLKAKYDLEREEAAGLEVKGQSPSYAEAEDRAARGLGLAQE